MRLNINKEQVINNYCKDKDMLNENYDTERSSWKFTYKAKEILPFAKIRLMEHQNEETNLRKQLAGLIQDPSSFYDDSKIQQLKAEVDRHSLLREQFEVYCHEFARTPNKEFNLKLSDIVFFRIHTSDIKINE